MKKMSVIGYWLLVIGALPMIGTAWPGSGGGSSVVVEQTVSASPSKVPSSAAVSSDLAAKVDATNGVATNITFQTGWNVRWYDVTNATWKITNIYPDGNDAGRIKATTVTE